MSNQNQISNAPLILGIIGGILGLPAAICSGACAAGFSSLTDNATQQTSDEALKVFLWIGLLAAFIGLIGEQ
jgi:hypothetical protein